jgi:hypothetical protein
MYYYLADFVRQRTVKQAVGLYFAWFLIANMLLFPLILILLPLAPANFDSFEESAYFAIQVATVSVIILCLSLCFYVCKAKGLLNSSLFVIMMIITGILSIVGALLLASISALLGLIPMAYLTTRSADTSY